MNNISLNVSGNTLTVTGGAEPLSGGYSYDKCVFTFDSEWTGYTKTVVFSVGNSEEYTEILQSNQCAVPEELLKKTGLLKIGVSGVNAAGTLISTNQAAIKIRRGSNESEVIPIVTAIQLRESGGGMG